MGKLVIFSISIAIIILFSCYLLLVKKTEKPSPFGNILTGYLYYTNTPYKTGILEEHYHHELGAKNSDVKKFLQNLDWSAQNNLIDYKSDYKATWNEINEDGSPKNNYLRYWQQVRPILRNLLEKFLPKTEVRDPIVHFRCSDTPFNYSVQYHLTKKASVVWMAEQIKQRGFNKATMISCNTHQKWDGKSCKAYIDYYTKIFNRHGIKIANRCGDIFDDLALMVYSPLLVSLNSSSYAFIAGVIKDPNSYISCNMGTEVNNKYVLQSTADWIIDTREPLLHRDVHDYTNTNDVITKLEND